MLNQSSWFWVKCMCSTFNTMQTPRPQTPETRRDKSFTRSTFRCQRGRLPCCAHGDSYAAPMLAKLAERIGFINPAGCGGAFCYGLLPPRLPRTSRRRGSGRLPRRASPQGHFGGKPCCGLRGGRRTEVGGSPRPPANPS